MDRLISYFRREPARVLSSLVALLDAASAFGLHLSGQQEGALVGLATALLALVAGQVIRSQVSPVKRRRRS